MDIASIQPLLPKIEKCETLKPQAFKIAKDSRLLAEMLPDATLQAIEELMIIVKSYYSNQIEGNSTLPIDIERAAYNDYDTDDAKRKLQQESLAHVFCQQKIAKRLQAEPDLRPASTEFLCWIHKTLYDQFPEAMGMAKHSQMDRQTKVVGGEIRNTGVKVGQHIAPPAELVPDMLQLFEATYSDRVNGESRIIAAAAAHHRLMWIHPFLDGNGRVARLFTDTYLKSLPLPGYGLWNVSRGLARAEKTYKAMLARADMKRQGDYDGRGFLSEKKLVEWCEYFLGICLTQIEDMSKMLSIDRLLDRIDNYVLLRHEHQIPAPCSDLDEGLHLDAAKIIKEVILRGRLNRNEAAKLTRSTRDNHGIIEQLVREKILVSESLEGPVRLGLPISFASWIFPELFPHD
jgi:Fic family protein